MNNIYKKMKHDIHNNNNNNIDNEVFIFQSIEANWQLKLRTCSVNT